MPSKKKIDQETSDQLVAGEKIKLMVESEGWQIVFESLKEKILDLQNLNNIDDSSPELALADLRARKLASDLLYAWLKADVHGRVEQYENNLRTMQDKRGDDESYINRPD